ncbi:electron transport complex subunit RsxC [Tissierella sp. Yu-01]|uniref:electron transport complex subunit RsxC n=1 Tax=Tissierella sp. Yu-01 TaxID=3035694 RepID=UPI00240D7F3F|nr:electron transport complex subunit RsxC [Tissierella sp. Yu-01]WFA08581.1 electron transport complex subunit RsxC [Tissierella sp. Yu-01]
MRLDNLTFKGGVHAPGHKGLTNRKPIIKAVDPKIVYIPLLQHVGSPCEAIVKAGDHVKVGQKIGESKAFVSAPVHSSVSGVVKDINLLYSPTGIKTNFVIIESDGLNELHESVKPKGNLEDLSPKKIVEIIKESGITGMGGAGFPTHVKLSPPPEKKIDTFILNGAECEPFLTPDHRMMLEMFEKIIFGAKALMKALSVENGFIAIEKNKMDTIKAFKSVLKDSDNIKLVTLKTKYPQGDEKRIINAITGREVPSGGLPLDVGCVVNNVSTAKAVADAIQEGKPLYERIVTVTGHVVKEPKVLLVKVGTPIQELIDQCGGFNEAPGKIIMGGPMMGMSQFSTRVPIIKGTGGILVLSEREVVSEKIEACIKCGKCLEVCPVYLQPLYISAYALKNNFGEAEKYRAMDCIECGACSYICPSKRPLTESIKLAKREIRARKK